MAALGLDPGLGFWHVDDPNDSSKVQAAETVTIGPGESAEDLAATIGHEGSHVADAQDFVASIDRKTGGGDQSLNLTKYATELKAYMVRQSILGSENVKKNFGDCGHCGKSDW